MADDPEAPKYQKFEYRSNAVMVLQQTNKRRGGPQEPTGEPETLAQHQLHRFGDRAITTKPKELQELERKKRKRAELDRAGAGKRAKLASGAPDLSSLDAIVEGVRYRPKTRETKDAYERVLESIKRYVGDQQLSIVMSAADELLTILKDDDIKPALKQKEVELLLGTAVPPQDFADIVNLSKKITDFVDDDEGPAATGDEQGISVVLGENEEEGDDLVEYAEPADDDEEDADGETKPVEEVGGDDGDAMDTDDAKPARNGNEADIDPRDIDAYWLQRQLNKVWANDADKSASMSSKVLEALSYPDDRQAEDELVALLDFEHFDLIKLFLRNRHKIVYCTRLGQAQNDETKRAIELEMQKDDRLFPILQALQSGGSSQKDFQRNLQRENQALKSKGSSSSATLENSLPYAFENRTARTLDLESLQFQAGGRTMTNKTCKLPTGSTRVNKKGYEEVHIPSPVPQDLEEKDYVYISKLPNWAQPAFEGMKKLNFIQSKLFPAAFETGENFLLCAPTGAGKTNVAMLAIMHEIGKHTNPKSLEVDFSAFKIVYIAPMKSLVQEMVFNFGERLKKYGIVVRELSGDSNLTKQEIDETQILVTTPEKWDIITRKSGDRTYTQMVKLVIIDEIHLLHDDRGPVLECIVARTMRQIETTQSMVRFVGLSATLPGYQEVATFLRVADPYLFAFTNSQRPVPLEQTFIGVNVKKPFKRHQLMNEITYDKVMALAGQQMLVFVHSRKETAKTCKALRDMAIEKQTLGRFLKDDPGARQVLQESAEKAKNPDLKDLLPYGFAIHHAGMVKDDRILVEDLFRARLISVLCSTATLAWGVNLPAYGVIIKGTQVYSPDKGMWTELSPLDVMQMLGRAGRPGYDKKGVGIVLTTNTELQFYLSLLNSQLPIESQLVTKLSDALNAEIVLGTVQNTRDAAEWLTYTYLYVCMLRNPQTYGISLDSIGEDKTLEQRRFDLIHTAATQLAKFNLIKYDRKSGNFQVTDLGRISSHYYITAKSMATYNEHLRPTTTDIDLLRIFSLSGEFQQVSVRADERLELEKLMERVPHPVKESIEEPTAKINVLLQSYISRMKLEGFSLASDMIYVTQSAGRIMRALFEIALRRGWSQVAGRCLGFCKMIERRMWSSQSPLRQFKNIPEETIKRLEKKDFTLERLYDLNAMELGELVRYAPLGKTIFKAVHQIPKVDLTANVQPITRNLLRVELTVTPDFEWDDKYHGKSMQFWLFVQDVDAETILHSELFTLKKRYATEEHFVSFTVPMLEPQPPQYYITATADRWLGSETVLPVSFQHLILPERVPPKTELLDLQPLPVAALKNKAFESLYKFTYFNAIQTQVFNTLYNTDQNSIVCAPTNSGKSACAEFAVLRELLRDKPGKIVYIGPLPAVAAERMREWKAMFGTKLGKVVEELNTGDVITDLKVLEKSDIVIATPEKWDTVSRRWRQRKAVKQVRLFIVDEVHLVNHVEVGPVTEVIVSRMRYMSHQLKAASGEKENPVRIVALGSSILNAKDLGDWIGATTHSLFNFHPEVRPIPMEIHMQGFDHPQASARMLAMSRPTTYAITSNAEHNPVLLFVPSRKFARQAAFDLVNQCKSLEDPFRFLHASKNEINPIIEKIETHALKEALAFGIGFIHDALTDQERQAVEGLFNAGAIQILITTFNLAWELSARAAMVIIMGTQYYEGKEHRYADYSITDMLQMLGRAGRGGKDTLAKCFIFCFGPKREYYKKFIYEPLPVESHLDQHMQDFLNAEIVSKTVENKQDAVDWMTWTFFYRRLTQNPNFYNMQGVTSKYVSDFLSELIEDTVRDLEQAKCVAVEEEVHLAHLNLGMIAAHYYIKYTTIELFNYSLNDKTKIRGLIDIISNASEFEDLPIRHKEDRLVEKMAAHLPLKIGKPEYTKPNTKVNVLLQSHFSRRSLSTDLVTDKNIVLKRAAHLIHALVDVVSSSYWLNPALAAMELCQMVVQGMWDSDSVFMQLPHFTHDRVERLKKLAPDVETIYDIGEMDDDVRANVLKDLTQRQKADIVRTCFRYPTIEVAFSVAGINPVVDEEDDKKATQPEITVDAGGAVPVAVVLERQLPDKVAEVGPVLAPHFPENKVENWWLVVGNPTQNRLHSIKRITFNKTNKVKLDFTAPEEAGVYDLQLYLICDSWMGCDQEFAFKLTVTSDMAVDSEANGAAD